MTVTTPVVPAATPSRDEPVLVSVLPFWIVRLPAGAPLLPMLMVPTETLNGPPMPRIVSRCGGAPRIPMLTV
ncbi:hypothetical protein ABIF65_010139 [Bradyrhizobium japonicum]|uniref:hypothetical protein n=1 Tax=Bradyrhizobium TaxID=374 RepID=UPI0005780213|nr:MULTISPECIES: hypothetical protein [Bradyrhizobium]MBR0877147.1 hypothetical protein [Bradyrhizobium liaoningense]MBR0946024.1 hypothetical protein [Bradyrhizobium liaoningense]MBR0997915.1 hypothetical protein [Bradyrhizobium liaoningense]MBR1027186.1 hypothetical protein [Bradyrhizobium liaoningense]MBR1063198.1 hypothetical protein [Bradyrhizobium liaoningense]